MTINKTTSTFSIIAILLFTVFVVGAYKNPMPNQFNAEGNPVAGPAVVPVSTQGPSQIKQGNLGIMGTFFARGNAILKDHVRVGDSIYGGNENGAGGTRVVQVGTPGETTPTSVFVSNNVQTRDRLRTQAPEVLAGGGTVPVCSDKNGFVVLCGEGTAGGPDIEDVPIPPPTNPGLPEVTSIRALLLPGEPAGLACQVTISRALTQDVSFQLKTFTGEFAPPFSERLEICTLFVTKGATAGASENRNSRYSNKYIVPNSTCVLGHNESLVYVPPAFRCN
jgi:hypothetical protein